MKSYSIYSCLGLKIFGYRIDFKSSKFICNTVVHLFNIVEVFRIIENINDTPVHNKNVWRACLQFQNCEIGNRILKSLFSFNKELNSTLCDNYWTPNCYEQKYSFEYSGIICVHVNWVKPNIAISLCFTSVWNWAGIKKR